MLIVAIHAADLATARRAETGAGAGLRIAGAVRQTCCIRPVMPACKPLPTALIRRESGLSMETPQIRPGLVKPAESMPRVVVFFPNSALGNLAIQLLMQIGIPNDRLGVTPPEQIEGGRA